MTNTPRTARASGAATGYSRLSKELRRSGERIDLCYIFESLCGLTFLAIIGFWAYGSWHDDGQQPLERAQLVDHDVLFKAGGHWYATTCSEDWAVNISKHDIVHFDGTNTELAFYKACRQFGR